jgi:hypothetical protein
MDAGSFIFDLDGVRWAEDLGKQEYDSLESKGINLWGMNQDSTRWKVFRLNNFSHNTLAINGRLHNVKGFAPITRFSRDDPAGPCAIVDLSEVFAGQAANVSREFRVISKREIQIQDKLEGLKSGDAVRWTMVTSAGIEITGAKAVLKQGGRQLEASIATPQGASFNVMPADFSSDGFDAPNTNTRILTINAAAPASGNVRICVRLKSAQQQ